MICTGSCLAGKALLGVGPPLTCYGRSGFTLSMILNGSDESETRVFLSLFGRIMSSFLSFHQEPYARQIVPSQWPAQPMVMPLAVVTSWGEQAVPIVEQTSRRCMVCLMPATRFLFVGKSPL